MKLAGCASTAALAQCVGIAVSPATANQPVSYQYAGSIAIGASISEGETYQLSATAGKIAPVGDLVSTNRVTRLGYGSDVAGEIILDINVTGLVLA